MKWFLEEQFLSSFIHLCCGLCLFNSGALPRRTNQGLSLYKPCASAQRSTKAALRYPPRGTTCPRERRKNPRSFVIAHETEKDEGKGLTDGRGSDRIAGLSKSGRPHVQPVQFGVSRKKAQRAAGEAERKPAKKTGKKLRKPLDKRRTMW